MRDETPLIPDNVDESLVSYFNLELSYSQQGNYPADRLMNSSTSPYPYAFTPDSRLYLNRSLRLSPVEHRKITYTAREDDLEPILSETPVIPTKREEKSQCFPAIQKQKNFVDKEITRIQKKRTEIQGNKSPVEVANKTRNRISHFSKRESVSPRFKSK